MTGSSLPAPCGFRDPRDLAGLPSDARLAVALSGGADSVALLLSVAPPVVAVHVHHGIRGAEADRDVIFCERLCRRLNIPFTPLFADVPARAKEQNESLETAARAERYRLLEDFAESSGVSAVLTAHHADDQLETLLQHLLRGSGLRGMCGIPAVRPLGKTILVRPMLHVTKEDVLAFLSAKGETYVTDSTNQDRRYGRNRLRLDIVPLLKEIAADAPEKAASTAGLLAEDEEYLIREATEFLHTNSTEPPVAKLAALPRPIFVRVIRCLVPVDLSAVHFAALWELVQKAVPHSSLSLPHVRARIENERLCFEKEKRAAVQTTHNDYMVFLQNGENFIPETGALVTLGKPACSLQNDEKKIYKYATSVSFLSDTVKGTLHVRNRRAGDNILHGGIHKAVRKLPGIAALPPAVRAQMPLLADDEGILAVPFCPPRDRADGKTQNDLTVWFYFN